MHSKPVKLSAFIYSFCFTFQNHKDVFDGYKCLDSIPSYILLKLQLFSLITLWVSDRPSLYSSFYKNFFKSGFYYLSYQYVIILFKWLPWKCIKGNQQHPKRNNKRHRRRNDNNTFWVGKPCLIISELKST